MSCNFRCILTFYLIPLSLLPGEKGDNSEFKLIKPFPPGGEPAPPRRGVGERSLNGDGKGSEEITFLSKFALHPN